MVKLILLSLLLRLIFLGSVPPALNWDEVSQGYTAYTLSVTGMDEWGEKLPLFFRSYGEWKSGVYIYLLVPFVKFLGLNAWSIRLPSALAGILSVYLMYLLGKKLFNRQTGLWSAFLFSVTPWTLMLGRPGFEANVALTMVLGGLYLFLTNRYFLSAILFGLAPHTYNSAKVVVPLLIIYLLISTKLYRLLKETILMLGILAVFAVPLLLNLVTGYSQARFTQVGVATDLKALDEFVYIRNTFPLPELGNKLLFNKYTYSLYKIADNWLSYWSPSFLAVSGGEHHQHSLPYHGVLYFSEFVIFLFGLTFLFKLGGPNRFLPLVLIALGILPAAMTRDTGHVLRSLLSAPGFILLSGLGFSSLSAVSSKAWFRLAVFILAVEIITFIFAYFTWYPKAYARDWQYGHAEVAEYLRAHEGEYNRIVMTKWYGEPQLFLAFYNRWDPWTYIENNRPLLRYQAEGRLWLDQLPEYELGKYTFKYLDWDNESQQKGILYIGKVDDFPSSVNLKKTVNYPDGSIAFILVEGDK